MSPKIKLSYYKPKTYNTRGTIYNHSTAMVATGLKFNIVKFLRKNNSSCSVDFDRAVGVSRLRSSPYKCDERSRSMSVELSSRLRIEFNVSEANLQLTRWRIPRRLKSSRIFVQVVSSKCPNKKCFLLQIYHIQYSLKFTLSNENLAIAFCILIEFNNP